MIRRTTKPEQARSHTVKALLSGPVRGPYHLNRVFVMEN